MDGGGLNFRKKLSNYNHLEKITEPKLCLSFTFHDVWYIILSLSLSSLGSFQVTSAFNSIWRTTLMMRRFVRLWSGPVLREASDFLSYSSACEYMENNIYFLRLTAIIPHAPTRFDQERPDVCRCWLHYIGRMSADTWHNAYYIIYMSYIPDILLFCVFFYAPSTICGLRLCGEFWVTCPRLVDVWSVTVILIFGSI